MLVRFGDRFPSQQVASGYAFLQRHHPDVPVPEFRRIERSYRTFPVPAELRTFFAPPPSPVDLGRQDMLPDGDQRALAPTPVHPMERPVSRPIFFQPSSSRDGSSHRPPRSVSLAPEVLANAKVAFTVRRVPLTVMRTLISGPVRPRSGDLVLARVDALHYQSRLELVSGRKAALQPGDQIVVAYGDRYATDQFEAEVPHNLGPTNLVATGGVASTMLSRTAGVRQASRITPLGLIGDQGGSPINLEQFALEDLRGAAQRPPLFAVLGTSMNSGKTTTIRCLVAGLSRAGLKPGTLKITGTGSGGDYWVMVDAGAHRVFDFTDAGYAATYRIPLDEIISGAKRLIDHLTAAGCGVILMEVADGLFQEQNAELIRTEFFRSTVDGVFFAAGEAMGADAGVKELRSLGLPVLGVSGKLTGSELLIREAARCDVPILTKAHLTDPVIAPKLIGMRPAPANDLDGADREATDPSPGALSGTEHIL